MVARFSSPVSTETLDQGAKARRGGVRRDCGRDYVADCRYTRNGERASEVAILGNTQTARRHKRARQAGRDCRELGRAASKLGGTFPSPATAWTTIGVMSTSVSTAIFVACGVVSACQ